jgi:hypothetical protein
MTTVNHHVKITRDIGEFTITALPSADPADVISTIFEKAERLVRKNG